MLSGFRRPAADFRVELSESTLRPGDELRVRVSLIPRDGIQGAEAASYAIQSLESYVVISPGMNGGVVQVRDTHATDIGREFCTDTRK